MLIQASAGHAPYSVLMLVIIQCTEYLTEYRVASFLNPRIYIIHTPFAVYTFPVDITQEHDGHRWRFARYLLLIDVSNALIFFPSPVCSTVRCIVFSYNGCPSYDKVTIENTHTLAHDA